MSVALKGTNIGTLTDASGRYTLQANSLASDTLVFSFIGYTRLEAPIGGRTTVNATLQAQAIALEELVVIGYGT
ncbi:MAG TPA: carboxypeptidase-like regulatory domain-containing protein, partial [Longimicrobiaceae bacterium]